MPSRPITPMPVRVPVLLAAAGLALAPAGAMGQGGPLSEPFPPVFRLSDLLSASGGGGSIGFVITSSIRRDSIGLSVESADIDDDGIDDLIFGADDPAYGGSAFAVFGSTGSWPATFDIRSVAPPRWTEVHRSSSGTRNLGFPIASGDVNGDGLDDFVVGARGTTPEPAYGYCDWTGDAFAVLGRDTGPWPARLAVETQPRIAPPCDEESSVGFAIGVGDFDGDGIDDTIVSAPHQYGSAGERLAYVTIYRGGASPFAQELARIEPGESDTNLGWFATFVGDVNGDGLEDVLVSEPEHSDGPRAFVIFGGASGLIRVDELSSSDGLLLKQPGWPNGSAWFGGVGDVNGDGLDDFAFSDTFLASTEVGAVYIVYGRPPTAPPLPFPLGPDDIDGEIGFAITGQQEAGLFGWPATGAGDIDGDGADDILVTARRYDVRGVRDAGATYLIYGRRAGFPASTPVADLPRTVRFEGIELNDRTGGRLGSGDLNGDGVPDIIIGASTAASITGVPDLSGRVYVVFGRRPDTCRPDLDGDGALTIFDFLAFGNLFDLMDPAADFDGDGDFTFFDFLAFQNAFDAGCP